jgi:hypothetical protein
MIISKLNIRHLGVNLMFKVIFGMFGVFILLMPLSAHSQSNPFGKGYTQTQNPFGKGYRQKSNPFGKGYRQTTNPFGKGYRQPTGLYKKWK